MKTSTFDQQHSKLTGKKADENERGARSKVSLKKFGQRIQKFS